MSTLYATRHLLNGGFVQEVGALKRILDEIQDDILFLLSGINDLTCPSYKFRPVQKSWSFRVMPDSVGGMHTILLHNASRMRNFDSVRIFGHDGLRLRMCRALFRELWQTRGLP